ncbi:hypothetical protein JOD18_003968 [Gracilibacillus alcaliphilus]|nr:hypothetical protein [Gracilibacillus alcaliphilus]
MFMGVLLVFIVLMGSYFDNNITYINKPLKKSTMQDLLKNK